MKRRDAGFTLLEMLVALVVFGLVMAGVAQSFRFGLAAWRQGPARTAEPENLAAMDAALARMIAQAQPGSITGEAGRFAFTTTLPAGAGLHGALADAAIGVQNGSLVLRYRAHPAGIPLQPLPPPRTETLAEGVTGLRLAYLAGPAGKAPAWQAKWHSKALPALVRLHIELADGRDWPDLIAAPVAGNN